MSRADQQFKFLQTIYGKEQEGFIFLAWRDPKAWHVIHTKSGSRTEEGLEIDAFEWGENRNPQAIRKFLRRHEKHDIYFTPCLFKYDERTKEGAYARQRVLYADLDEVDPRQIQKELKPSIAWRTSTSRYQCIWQLDDWYDSTEELNQRLNYFVGADNNGWALNKYLRMPWCLNSKPGRPQEYGDMEFVRRRAFSYAEVDKLVPPLGELRAPVIREVNAADIEDIDRKTVWRNVRDEVSTQVRDWVIRKEAPTQDEDRSKTLRQIELELAAAGLDAAEIVSITRGTVWNKFRGRRNELHELGKRAAEAVEVKRPSTDMEDVKIRSIWDVSTTPLEPVGLGLYKGAVTVLLGHEGSLKSTACYMIAKAFATGTDWDPIIPAGPRKHVVIIESEPNMSQQRLKAYGAKPGDPISIFTDKDANGFPEFPDAKAMEELRNARPDLVIVDVWADTVKPDLQLSRGEHGIAAMKPWVQFAKERECPVLLVAHTNRNAAQSTESRDMYGLTSALRKKARATLIAFTDDESGKWHVGLDKTNLESTEQKNKTYVFGVVSKDSGIKFASGKPIEFPHLVFEEEQDRHIYLAFRESKGENIPRISNKRITARDVLTKVLGDGRLPRSQAIEKAQEWGEILGIEVKERALQYAWEQIGKDGMRGQKRYTKPKSEGGELFWSLSGFENLHPDYVSDDEEG